MSIRYEKINLGSDVVTLHWVFGTVWNLNPDLKIVTFRFPFGCSMFSFGPS